MKKSSSLLLPAFLSLIIFSTKGNTTDPHVTAVKGHREKIFISRTQTKKLSSHRSPQANNVPAADSAMTPRSGSASSSPDAPPSPFAPTPVTFQKVMNKEAKIENTIQNDKENKPN